MISYRGNGRDHGGSTSSPEQVLTTSGAARSRRAPFQVLSREDRQDPFVDLILAEDSLVFPKAMAPKPNHDTSMTAPQTQVTAHHRSVREVCPGGSKIPFSVSIGVGVKTVPRSLLAYPVPISARGNDRKLCQHAVSNHRLVAVGGARDEVRVAIDRRQMRLVRRVDIVKCLMKNDKKVDD